MNQPYRHIVYAYLIRYCLCLYEYDLRDLEKHWGLTPAEMYRESIVSMPSEIAKLIICVEIAKRFELEGVAGFFLDGERWSINLPYRKGLLKPYRNKKLQILGVQVYRDVLDRDPRLLTSRGLHKGSIAIPPSWSHWR